MFSKFDFSNIEKKPLDAIGFFGPGILFVESIIRLSKQRQYLVGYLVSFFINYPFNQFLKNWIREPRPMGGQSFIGESYGGADHYGMPSLHAQSSAISVMFLYLSKGFTVWILFELFVIALVVHQRYVYKRHTMKQLIVGLIFGCFAGWLGWFLTNTFVYRNAISISK